MISPSWITAAREGSMLDIWIAPGSSRSEIVGAHGDALKIRLTAPPEAGRANRELVELLSACLGVRVQLVSGRTSRRKRVWVPASPPDAVVGRLLPPNRR